MQSRLSLFASLALVLPLLTAASKPKKNAASPPSSGQKKWFTYPQPPHIKASDQAHPAPAYEVPQHPEWYTWKITNKINGKVAGTADVPVYGERTPKPIGSLPVGSVVTIEGMQLMTGIMYYWIPFAATPGGRAWVSGLNIEPANYTPPAK